MRSQGSRATAKIFFAAYAAYLAIVLSAADVAVGFDRDYFVQHGTTYAWLLGPLILLPFLILVLSLWQGAFAKWLRLISFWFLRVEVFALFGLCLLVAFTVIFLRNFLLARSYYAEQIFFNVLILNLLFIFLLALILADRFRVRQPSDLLLQKEGDSRIYLYQNGVIRHIPDPPTLILLGYSFDDVTVVSDKEFAAYSQKPPLESVRIARLVQVEDGGDGRVWMILGETKRHIPDTHTLDTIRQLKDRSIEMVTEQDLSLWEEGRPLVSLFGPRSQVR